MPFDETVWIVDSNPNTLWNVAIKMDKSRECVIVREKRNKMKRSNWQSKKNFHFHSSKHIGLIAAHAFTMWFHLLFISKTILILRFDAPTFFSPSERPSDTTTKKMWTKSIRLLCWRWGLRFNHRVHFEIRHSSGYCCLRYCCKFVVDWFFVKANRIE